MMFKGKFVFPAFVFLILTALASVSAARTIYVPDDYASIQQAVDSASDGDTIVVRDGTYYESITVSRQLTIKSEKGPENCIVNGTGSTVFTLKADGIRIEGFTITGGGEGIFLEYSNNNSISNNNISSNNWRGIYLYESNNNSISNNNISSNNDDGIYLKDSNDNTIESNEFINDGLFVRDSYRNEVRNNTVNGKPLVYLEGESDEIFHKAGQVILINCLNITIMNSELTNTDVGIELWMSNKCSIYNNIISSNNWGIYLCDSNNNSISNNNISSNIWDGIYHDYSNKNSISNNIISLNNYAGISFWYSNKNNISNNNISSNNFEGIFLGGSNENSISKNNISSNKHDGIYLMYSNENIISNNEFINDGLFVDYSYNNIVEYNKVNGKPLIYLEDESDEFVDDAGQVILVRCKNITVMNAELTNTDVGIELLQSDNCLISNNNISNNDDGIFLVGNNNSISNNIISSNNEDGIHLYFSDNNSISKNNISNNDAGIDLGDSNNNSISDNNISNNFGGIYLGDSNNNSISNNNISSNIWDGIYLFASNENSISENNIISNNFGIYIEYSDNNCISENNISNNFGIYIECSNNNIIYLNNFINNTYNVDSYGSTDIWNSTEPIKYTYKGSKFKNYMGNYWDDYTGSDENGDGIGDIPYSINADEDSYPLIERFEHYFLPTPTPSPTPSPTPTPSPSPTPTPAQIFDTGRPENPYPSISGEFVGTIRTNTKIIAKKLYTYACEGTGGHTEYALIWNKTWCAEAKWEGYKGDWMNISFNKTVILMPYETYNITIMTGSYPQIHHTHSLKTENGWINCTEFIDANGNKYDDWIPAIMLWS